MVIEVSGKDLDEHCLHCVLAPAVAQFQAQHPDKNSTQILGEIAQLCGDLIASGVYNAGKNSPTVEDLVEFVQGVVRESATLALDVFRKSPPPRIS